MPQGLTAMQARYEEAQHNFQTLEIDEMAVLLTHEFGHVLGLGHCLDCDSAMNYSWATRGRIHVTDLDVKTFLALVAQPNAF
jgi:predicted Zn-dependent protease